jgi:hypothetical protein
MYCVAKHCILDSYLSGPYFVVALIHKEQWIKRKKKKSVSDREFLG